MNHKTLTRAASSIIAGMKAGRRLHQRENGVWYLGNHRHHVNAIRNLFKWGYIQYHAPFFGECELTPKGLSVTGVLVPKEEP